MDEVQRQTVDNSFLAYPSNKVVGVIDDPDQLETTLNDLQTLNIEVDNIVTLCGQQGIDQLDRSGKRHGLIAQVIRLAQFMGEEQVHLKRHEEELKAGHYVIGVAVGGDEEMKRKVAQVLHAHGGHYVHYFGRFAVEDLFS